MLYRSKDTFVKFWDLDTRHCFKTLVTHRTEIWDFVLTHDDTRLITGSIDTELRVFKLEEPVDKTDESGQPEKRSKTDEASKPTGDAADIDSDDEENDDTMHLLNCVKVGSLRRHGRGRVLGLSVDKHDRFVSCHGNENLLEVYQVYSPDEAAKHFTKRQRKARKRARESADGATAVAEGDEGEGDADMVQQVQDEFKRLGDVKMSSKIRSIDVVADQSKCFRVSADYIFSTKFNNSHHHKYYYIFKAVTNSVAL